MEAAYLCCRPADRAKRPKIDGAVCQGQSDCRGVPSPHAAGARRLPLCPAGDHPAPDALIITPLSATHDISRLPNVERDKPVRREFKAYPLGYFHIGIAEARIEQGRLYLIVAIDRTSKFAFVELHGKATTRVAGNFLPALTQAVPYKIHTVLTDNREAISRRDVSEAGRGIHFTAPGNIYSAAADIREAMDRGGAVPRACFRVRLRAKPHRTSFDQAPVSLDEWRG